MERKVVIVIVTLITTIMWYSTESDSAVVRSSQEFSEAIEEMLRSTVIDNVRDLRSTDLEERNGTRHICQGNPCGWAIYTKFTRRFEYFMRNTCECPDYSYKCVHTEDDLSVSAYVYRCRQNTTSNDTEAPPEDTN
ncbi:uncharacterized protein V1477_016502 [Vespula maculifrons]|uniref:Uncharacterized protein n=4 Tax=Vespula TaxID=7451 RepID=A0A834JEE3_VESGE|nr:uncharacterized protein LOC122635001 [Vespula pensylvanica]XP_050863210.1 uncharacterized protein LOC127069783 [Vespula vulgaris]KAF7384410.1 hypothetical protein HZH66_012660 [Vespula vulgaris]KAF7385559.1 hypothetical protein HZH68_013989 [Vespula germanica]KAF7404462.1 hypothetical protein H0235_015156 [Vespula pensylvanica]